MSSVFWISKDDGTGKTYFDYDPDPRPILDPSDGRPTSEVRTLPGLDGSGNVLSGEWLTEDEGYDITDNIIQIKGDALTATTLAQMDLIFKRSGESVRFGKDAEVGSAAYSYLCTWHGGKAFSRELPRGLTFYTYTITLRVKQQLV